MSEPTIGMPVTDGKDQFRCEFCYSTGIILGFTFFPIDISRVGKINQGPNMTGSLRVLEVDLADFRLDDPSSKVWPDFAPRVDGVIVCYDSSLRSSFVHVERLVCTIQLPYLQERPTDGSQVVTMTSNYRLW